MKKRIKILADSNFKSLMDSFTTFADIQFVEGRSIKKQHLAGIDALLVRSVTEVTEELIHSSGLKFVGTATSGVEHVDLEVLADAGIFFSSAKGANADSVCDYVIAALVALDKNCESFVDRFVGRTYGIIGAGEVGRRLVHRLLQCGVQSVLVYDPPLQNKRNAEAERLAFATLDEVLGCDVVSVHVPFERSGKYPTAELLDAEQVNKLRPGAIFINASRGGILDEAAMLDRLKSEVDYQRHERLLCVLDVWEAEPFAWKALVGAVDLATPHIAGYSAQAKQNAIQNLHGKLADVFGIGRELKSSVPSRAFILSEVLSQNLLNSPAAIVSALYPLAELSEQMKFEAMHGEGPGFDEQRSKLRLRNEFQAYMIDKSVKLNKSDRLFLKGLNFLS
ncbi:4-phosphoerythronate dehydrogenase [OM182 bacterium]|nr:4-phosphoerythronate dehydrogenase [OM182 bacterium]